MGWNTTTAKDPTRPNPTSHWAPSSQAHWQRAHKTFTCVHTYIHTYRWVWTGNLFETGRGDTIEPSSPVGSLLGWFFRCGVGPPFLSRSPICWTISTLTDDSDASSERLAGCRLCYGFCTIENLLCRTLVTSPLAHPPLPPTPQKNNFNSLEKKNSLRWCRRC
jgi:hypothetical protein